MEVQIENPEATLSALESELWLRGDLSYLMKPNSQLPLDRKISDWRATHPDDPRPIVINSHRGWGKSHYLILAGIQECVRRPGWMCRFGSPTLTQTEEIAEPILRKILGVMPKAITVRPSGPNYYFKNPRWPENSIESCFSLFSCKDDAENMRGKRANWIAVDEVRGIKDRADYVIDEVLLFLFASQEDPCLILSSTPPDIMDHPFSAKYVPDAQLDGRYFINPITDNPDFSEREKTLLANACGGIGTLGWRREALCEMVPDPRGLAVPEFHVHRSGIVVAHPRPTHFFPYLAMDAGFHDYTAVLFSYCDFSAQKIIIEDEFVQHYRTTEDIVRQVKDKEEKLYAGTSHVDYIRRFADAPPQTLYDLRETYGFPFSPAQKWDKQSALADLRSAIQGERILIHPRCRNLIHQLTNGQLNKSRKDFERSKEIPLSVYDDRPVVGHCDALMALVYLWRMVKPSMLLNPFPDPRLVYRGDPNIVVDLPTEDIKYIHSGLQKITRHDIVRRVG